MSDETRLNELLDCWADIQERGSKMTIEQVCDGRLELVDELRRRITALHGMDSMAADGAEPSTDHVPGTRSNSLLPPDALPAVSPFLRPPFHGARGGLGEVYRWCDQQLNREVALEGYPGAQGRLSGGLPAVRAGV